MSTPFLRNIVIVVTQFALCCLGKVEWNMEIHTFSDEESAKLCIYAILKVTATQIRGLWLHWPVPQPYDYREFWWNWKFQGTSQCPIMGWVVILLEGCSKRRCVVCLFESRWKSDSFIPWRMLDVDLLSLFKEGCSTLIISLTRTLV